MPDNALTPHVYLTLDDNDENQVLELVKVDGPAMFIRDNGVWQRINPEDDNERVWDRQIIDVEEIEATQIFDAAQANGNITRELFEDAELEDDEAYTEREIEEEL